MKALAQSLNLNVGHILAGILMACLWGWFAYWHVQAFLIANDWSYFYLCISETLIALCFLVRKCPKSVSAAPFDWAIAVVGTFASFLFIPASSGILPSAKYAVIAGSVLTILGIISLNRSFALVASKREIKTSGLYCVVRHPLYASYLLTFTGYIFANSTLENVIVYFFTMGCMFIRMFREERHLSLDAEYLRYTHEVRWRLIPFVF